MTVKIEGLGLGIREISWRAGAWDNYLQVDRIHDNDSGKLGD